MTTHEYLCNDNSLLFTGEINTILELPPSQNDSADFLLLFFSPCLAAPLWDFPLEVFPIVAFKAKVSLHCRRRSSVYSTNAYKFISSRIWIMQFHLKSNDVEKRTQSTQILQIWYDWKHLNESVWTLNHMPIIAIEFI